MKYIIKIYMPYRSYLGERVSYPRDEIFLTREQAEERLKELKDEVL